MKQVLTPLLAFGMLLLAGCSTYRAKSVANADMEAFCRIDGGVQVLRSVALPAKYFKDGVLQFDRLPSGVLVTPLTIAGRYVFDSKSENLRTLPEHGLELRKTERAVVDSVTGETLATSRSYCGVGGDSLTFNRTVECCPPIEGIGARVFRQEVQ